MKCGIHKSKYARKQWMKGHMCFFASPSGCCFRTAAKHWAKPGTGRKMEHQIWSLTTKVNNRPFLRGYISMVKSTFLCALLKGTGYHRISPRLLEEQTCSKFLVVIILCYRNLLAVLLSKHYSFTKWNSCFILPFSINYPFNKSQISGDVAHLTIQSFLQFICFRKSWCFC